ncbi:polysaccharide deacetylase family sporulation protein PdaB [Bacillaceae bacterium]
MKFFWVVSGKKLKQYVIVFAAALFAVGITYAEKESITVFTQTSETAAIYKVETKEKKLALTFDISWGEERAIPILDVLKEKGVRKATFFLSAPWSQNHPEIVQQILDAGFEIGSQGYKHIHYSRLENDEIRAQIQKAHQILKEVTGTSPKLLRPPNGDIDKRVLEIAHDLGYTIVLWDTDSKDWLNPGVDQIVNNVVQNAHPGDIILLHASDSAKQTHLALPKIIDRLREQGYEFVTVSELISGANAKSTEID